jgi:hypothetical protein
MMVRTAPTVEGHRAATSWFDRRLARAGDRRAVRDRQLADLGARVIKIERPGAGDFARGYDHRVDGLSSHFVWVNRSKSLALDVKDRGGVRCCCGCWPRRTCSCRTSRPVPRPGWG